MSNAQFSIPNVQVGKTVLEKRGYIRGSHKGRKGMHEGRKVSLFAWDWGVSRISQRSGLGSRSEAVLVIKRGNIEYGTGNVEYRSNVQQTF